MSHRRRRITVYWVSLATLVFVPAVGIVRGER